MNTHRAPDLTDLRRVWAWKPCPWGGGPADRLAVAWHEAGHAVYARWIGWDMRRVELHADGGDCFPEPIDPEVTHQLEDEDGEIRATAAGLFHAGLAAELLRAKLPWRGPIARPRQTDHHRAETMLAPGFGANTLPGHAYAQLQALHALSAHWDEVAAIAAILQRDGVWSPQAMVA
ncbi:hypothetical protein GCM10022279_25750 [Comamonas faecalis]|uniref:Peptidase M41 domain-containing protein n=1 Tax=Comamonas faecalis TaxID=1387849 RepID=A0ABP7RQ72_9BURK